MVSFSSLSRDAPRRCAETEETGLCQSGRGQTQSVDTHFNKDDEDQAARRDEKWKDKIANGAKYGTAETGIHKMLKGQLNIGWQTWRFDVAASPALSLRGNDRSNGTSSCLLGNWKLTAAKKQQVEVEVIANRCSSKLRPRGASWPEEAFSELGDGITIARRGTPPPPPPPESEAS